MQDRSLLTTAVGTGLHSDDGALPKEGSISTAASDLPVALTEDEDSVLSVLGFKSLDLSKVLLVPETLTSAVFNLDVSLLSLNLLLKVFLSFKSTACLFKGETSFLRTGVEFSELMLDCSLASFRKRAARTSATSTPNKMVTENALKYYIKLY